MKQTIVLASLAVLSGVAHADRPRPTYQWYAPSADAPNADPENMGLVPAVTSHVIYMNNCQAPNDCTLHPGNNNSTQNYSSIPTQTSTVPAYTGSAANWTALVNCVKQTYAPFDVQIVTTRPTSGNYHMAIVAGTPQSVQQPSGVLGVSPFSCGYISNSVSFTFANLEPTNILDLCWTVSQETAHSWGLDHKFDNRDPMTYLETGPTMKTFQNQAGSCGEYSARQCSCTYTGTGSAQMNSYALIMATFGSSAPDTAPPTISITTPADGAVIPNAGFSVVTDANDDHGVAKVDLRIDGTLLSTDTSAPYAWNTPTTLGQGTHVLQVKAYDGANNTATATSTITIGMVCHGAEDCPNQGDTCVDGRCVAGPGGTGGLGATCESNADCISNQCGDDGNGHKYCVENCDIAQDGCPPDFGCLATGPDSGVCWPGADNANGKGNGGGCSTGGSSGAMLLGVGLAGLVISRKRRRH